MRVTDVVQTFGVLSDTDSSTVRRGVTLQSSRAVIR